jgi:hypothetical protein
MARPMWSLGSLERTGFSRILRLNSPIFRPYYLSITFDGLETVGSSKMQELRMACPPKSCGKCKFCNQAQEPAAHLLFHCCFSRRISMNLKYWCALIDIQEHQWTVIPTAKDWWRDVIQKIEQSWKVLASPWCLYRQKFLWREMPGFM